MKMTKENAIKITNKYYEDIKTENTRKAQEYCDTVVDTKIEERAKIGCRDCTFFNVDSDIIYEVCNIIRKNGFFTRVDSVSTITVKWYDQ